MRRITVPVVTAADGSATVYSPRVTGKIHSVHYIKDGANAFADGVDFAITAESTAQGIWTQSDVNASAAVAPRQPTHSQAGVASLYAAGGTAVQAQVALGNDRIKIAIAQGGNAKAGKFVFLVD